MTEWFPTLTHLFGRFEFGLPWLFLLLPLAWLVYRFSKPMGRQQSALLVPFYADLPLGSTPAASSPANRWNLPLAVVIWLSVLTAAAGPRWIGNPVELPVTGRDTMLAVDLSESMTIKDLPLNGREADRLEVIKDVVSKFIDNRKGDRLGLILFGSNAYLQTPLTFDVETVRTLLNESTIGIAGPMTAIGDAIGLGVRQLRKRPKEQRVMVLLTDGANTAGNLSPLKAAELAAKEGVTIYSVGVGADEMIIPGLFGSNFGAQRVNPSADLDEETLTKIAEQTGGRYFRARSQEDLQEIYRTIDSLEPIEQSKETFRPVKELFYWPLGLALLLSALMALIHFASRFSSNKEKQPL
ncbi:vWA domain-containing protein [Parendozoicomonas haliclonae]|uniref:von Willebrand factor type A domain protein n=1 Tax=Parendozoicomonas haliclonae TaxID=1960125 RepID=A0A1X7AMN3_9GAMM|nr:VWA domain-containing protein [Parendozoicomonas haliclonae]SMA49259.1 von Willebrand factor type A domain protein [Parendozoicomonas haliclonae]